jgi:hypothetical protein
VALPKALSSCADVEAVVSHYSSRSNVELPELRADGTWTEAVVRGDRNAVTATLVVRERDIEVFTKCWEEAYRTDKAGADLDRKLPESIGRLFPMTEPIAKSLTGLAGRVVQSGWPPDQVLQTLKLLGTTPNRADGSEDPELEQRRAEIAPTVVRAMRDQWWQCWDALAKKWDEDAATASCRDYTGVVTQWLLGDVWSGEEAERTDKQNSADRVLRNMLLMSKDPQDRQIAVLAAFGDGLYELQVPLARLGLKDRDPSVRLMVVRLADGARLDEAGQPNSSELRDLLVEASKSDPDAAVRRDAKTILALPPYGGPG